MGNMTFHHFEKGFVLESTVPFCLWTFGMHQNSAGKATEGLRDFLS